jgi:hypothetical protein
MEGFSFVTPVTGLNRRNTGKEDDDDDVTLIHCYSGFLCLERGHMSGQRATSQDRGHPKVSTSLSGNLMFGLAE